MYMKFKYLIFFYFISILSHFLSLKTNSNADIPQNLLISLNNKSRLEIFPDRLFVYC